MSGLDQLQYLSWLLYLFVFIAVLARAIRRPTPAHVDMTLFFGAVAIVIVLTTVSSRLHLAQPAWLFDDIVNFAALAMGYLLLRLVRDFSTVPGWLLRLVEIGFGASVVAVVAFSSPPPPAITLLQVAYLVLVISYDTWAFLRQSRSSRGVTRRRMQAAAAGSLSLALVLLAAGLQVGVPDFTPALAQISAALGLVSGVCYFIGFAPPAWLRRAWQEPELRNFLSLAASLPLMPDQRSMVHVLERGAADALGAPAANIALWDEDSRMLRVFVTPDSRPTGPTVAPNGMDPVDADVWQFDPAVRPISGQTFLSQRASLIADTRRADPENARVFEQFGARAMLSAPITVGDNRLGVLIVYAPRAPVFANTDLELVQLLADQAAVILESRALIEKAASVRAREEAARLKEDFLSSAAHDLKTPLTGLVTQAQVLQRRAQRSPDTPVDRAGVDRLLQQSLRLRDLVLKLLDVTRLEHGGLVGDRQPLDVAELVKQVINQQPDWHRVRVDMSETASTVALIDELRFEQVLLNLIENGLKYSVDDSPVLVRVWAEGDEVRLTVQDFGIGIPVDDQPHVFERFHRAGNVDDRRFAGMGLGLFIARGIVEQHGGRIWVESRPGDGSTFGVALPRVRVEDHQRTELMPLVEDTIAST